MTKIIIIIFFSLLIPNIVFAYIQSNFDFGGKYNPIYTQEIKDSNEVQRNLNTQKENSLKSSYGISNYYDCYSAYESSCGITADTGNPYNQASCLGFIQYCLERKAMNNSRSDADLNNACIRKFGQGSYLAKRDNTGGTICGCRNGYKINQERTQCVVTKKNIKETLTSSFFDLICQKSSGINSFYSGETDINKGGGLGGCSCKVGFQFEHGNYGQCISNKIKTNESSLPAGCPSTAGYSSTTGVSCDGSKTTKTNDQICQDSYGLNSAWDGTRNNEGGLICDCKTEYQWNSGQTQCTSISKTKAVMVIPSVPVPKIEPKVTAPIIKKILEIKKVKKKIKKNTFDDSILNGERNSANVIASVDSGPISLDKKVVTSTEKTKSKSLWASIKIWFSFFWLGF